MYERLGSWGDFNVPMGVHARQEHVNVHQGQPRDFLRRHERAASTAAQRGRDGFIEIAPHLHKRVADTRNLWVAWEHLKRHGGQAPGPNGLTYHELTNKEVWELMRYLQSLLLAGTYRPGGEFKKRIPKVGKSGTRSISVQNVEDRVVQRAIVQIIQPLLDPTFDDNSDGFRPNRNRQHALAKALQLVEAGHWVWVVADIKDAFDKVPQQRLMDIIRLRLPHADELADVIETTLHNGTKRGIRQGSPLAPLLLNLFLDHLLDREWHRKQPSVPLLRTADDILLPCRTLHEARTAHTQLKRMLKPAGMLLKAPRDEAIVDLRADRTAHWLGYAVAVREEEPEVRIGENAWESLKQCLALAHTKPAAPLRAVDIVNGWLDQLGPSYQHEDRDQAVARVLQVAAQLAFDELPDDEGFVIRWRAAYARWRRIYAVVGKKDFGGSASHVDFSAELGRSDGAFSSALSLPFSSSNGGQISLFTDGCCLPHSRVGGWSFIITEGTGDAKATIERSSGIRRTTNNRAELLAVIAGITAAPCGAVIHLHSDSKYVVGGINERLSKWQERGWRTCSKKPLKNLDLWKRLFDLLMVREVRATWIKGHNGHVFNERCHQLAREAALDLHDRV